MDEIYWATTTLMRATGKTEISVSRGIMAWRVGARVSFPRDTL